MTPPQRVTRADCEYWAENAPRALIVQLSRQLLAFAALLEKCHGMIENGDNYCEPCVSGKGECEFRAELARWEGK